MGRRARGIVAAGAAATIVAGTLGALALVGVEPFATTAAAPPDAAPSSRRHTHAPSTATTGGADAIDVAGIVVEAPPADAAPPPAPTAPIAPPAPPAPPAAAAAEPAPLPEPPPAPEPAPCPALGGSGVAGIVESHRSVRCELGLPDVALDPAMNVHAQFHAERLMAEGACASLWHSSELSAWYPAGYWGENAACMSWSKGCWSDAGPVVEGWMGSPTHRPNIVKPEYRYLGVGIACDGQRTYFVVHFRS